MTGNGATGVIKSGYDVDMIPSGTAGPADCNTIPTDVDYTATAIPQVLGTSGQRGFSTTAAGTLFFDPAGTATPVSPLQ